MSTRLGALAALGALASLALPASVGAQDGKPCVIVFTGVARGADTTRLTAFTTPSGGRNTFVGGGVDATCEGQGNRLLADSAEHYTERGELILINRVRYTEPKMTMDSDRMIYYTTDDHLLATGNVRGKSASGTRFTGPQIEYFRAKPGVRDVPSWRAPGRPFVRMSPTAIESEPPRSAAVPPGNRAAAAATSADSVDLTADLVISVNDSLVFAVGKVVIERPDLRATADSATLDQGTEFARLMREPVIVGRGERTFTLVGTVVDLWSKDRKLRRVRADGAAKVTSDSLTLTGDTIDLRMADQRMERVFVWGGRAVADAPSQRLLADSMDILMPGQRLREIHALRDAIAFSTVDTAKIVSTERDWIAGDTIVARFDTLATADSTSSVRMREVLATGAARAFYQLVPSDGERGAPNLSYNRGRVITVSFDGGEVRDVAVQEKASGLFLEPVPVDTAKTAKGAAIPPKNAGRKP
jgi:hypothetical protein